MLEIIPDVFVQQPLSSRSFLKIISLICAEADELMNIIIVQLQPLLLLPQYKITLTRTESLMLSCF